MTYKRTQTNTKNISPLSLGLFNMKLDQNQILSGPSRVFPGRLSVCRSFGDIEAKSEKHGGNPRVLIAEPEVNIIKLTEEHDYILIGCKYYYIISKVMGYLINYQILKY